jgi:hypothetical protein
MARYTVVWHDEAQNQLAEIWMSTSDRQLSTQAANAADRYLADDASTKGIGIEGDLRLLIIPPLRFLFAVSEADRMVRILDVSSA